MQSVCLFNSLSPSKQGTSFSIFCSAGLLVHGLVETKTYRNDRKASRGLSYPLHKRFVTACELYVYIYNIPFTSKLRRHERSAAGHDRRRRVCESRRQNSCELELLCVNTQRGPVNGSVLEKKHPFSRACQRRISDHREIKVPAKEGEITAGHVMAKIESSHKIKYEKSRKV